MCAQNEIAVQPHSLALIVPTDCTLGSTLDPNGPTRLGQTPDIIPYPFIWTTQIHKAVTSEISVIFHFSASSNFGVCNPRRKTSLPRRRVAMNISFVLS